MAASDAEVVVACANILGESPTWSAAEQALYWVDIRAPALHRFEPARNLHNRWVMPELCPAVVLASNATVVLAWRRSLVHFDPRRNETTHLVDIEPPSPENRLNEAKVDRVGRLWVGSMRDFGAAVCGSLYMLTSIGQPKQVLSGIRVPNCLGWSPDNRVMYFADSGDGDLRSYRYDFDTATLNDEQILVPHGVLPGRPDGCAVDAEGCLWNARYGGGCVARITPDGRTAAKLKLAVSQPTSCSFGGPDLQTLYITTAAQRLSPAEHLQQPFAGHLFAAKIDVPGLLDMEFSYRARPTVDEAMPVREGQSLRD